MKNNELDTEILPMELKKELINFKKIVRQALTILQIPTDDKNIFYQRTPDGISLLGIKLTSGEDEDRSNYMLNISKSYLDNEEGKCDIYNHADRKCSKEAIELANLMKKQIIVFFSNTEKIIYKNNIQDMKIDVHIPLEDQKNKLESENNSKPESLLKDKCKKLIKTLFNK